MRSAVTSGISTNFLELSRSRGQVAHVLLTRSPLGHPPEGGASLDLHVLSTPPAFVLSQDQTLRECCVWLPGPSTTDRCAYGVIAGLDKLCARRVPKESATGSRSVDDRPQAPRTGL